MRHARVLSYALDPPTDAVDGERVATNLELVLALLEDATRYDPDFVCFPEYVLQLRYRGDGLARDEVAVPVPGEATEAVGEKAAALDSYVWLPTLQREGNRVYNGVALIGRDGEIAGVAHKAAPTIGEMNEGTNPGETVQVWETAFGRVGAAVCWDERYPELGVRFAQRRADIVFHPTTASGYQRFLTWAKYYGYHHVTCDKHVARVITPTGARLAETTTSVGNPVVDLPGGASARPSFAVINTDSRTYGAFQNREEIDAAREIYGGRVTFHQVPGTGNIVIESIDEALAVADVEADVGLETMVAYEERTRARVFEETDRSPLLPFEGQSSVEE